jgi:hypothetical protein
MKIEGRMRIFLLSPFPSSFNIDRPQHCERRPSLSSDKKKHKRKVKTHWMKKRRRASRALRRRGR